MRKISIYLIAIFVIVIGFWGCTKDNEVENPNEITYYFWEEPTVLSTIEKFNNSQNEVTVIPKPLPINDYEIKLLALLSARSDVDAFAQKTQVQMFNHYENGFIAPLDDIDVAKKFDFGIYDSYKKSITADGKYLALPFRGANRYVYFNKTLFDKANEPYPTTYLTNNEWTWKKFEEVAERIHKKTPEVYGANLHIWPSFSLSKTFQEGTEFIDAKGNIDIDQHKDTILGDFSMRKRMEKSGAMWPMQDLKVSKMHYSTAFFGGTVAMLIIGEWFPGFLINAKKEDLFQGFTWDDWGVVRIPQDTNRYIVPAVPTFSHITSFSKKKDAAFKFLTWYAGPEGAASFAKAGLLPSVITNEVRANMKELFPSDDAFNAFMEVPDEVLPITFNEYGSAIDKLLGEMFDSYLSTDMTEDELYSTLTKRLKRIVDEH